MGRAYPCSRVINRLTPAVSGIYEHGEVMKKYSILTVCVTAVLACLASPTNAQVNGDETQTVFGFELGKPLNLPECTYQTVGRIKLYDTIPTKTCVHEATTINGYKQPVRRIIFSQEEAPTIVQNWAALALEVNGNLVGIEFFTPGVAAQDLVMDTLTKKYGKPDSAMMHNVQNSFGAGFSAVSATWDMPNIHVHFEGVTDRLDSGNVKIDLPIAAKLRESWLHDDRQGQKGL